MKKHFLAILPVTVLATGLILFTGISQAADAGLANDGGLATLRGAPVSAPEKAPTGDALKPVPDTEVFDRIYDDQPPLVSHAVDKYPVTKDVNKCLDCHSAENYKKEKATKIGSSHFKDANGKTLPNVSSRRHFCLQCHVPQVDAKELVSNTFQRAE
ncbi:MAG: nitrate reductase cytochrome c-type subunit [Zoogloeaceae bacterium]|jgi:cytochrome c-type protein NapB|nr:nitrate reductase cytochrome c-type subunit [Zoogloeaceae bacterium]